MTNDIIYTCEWPTWRPETTAEYFAHWRNCEDEARETASDKQPKQYANGNVRLWNSVGLGLTDDVSCDPPKMYGWKELISIWDHEEREREIERQLLGIRFRSLLFRWGELIDWYLAITIRLTIALGRSWIAWLWWRTLEEIVFVIEVSNCFIRLVIIMA